MNSACPTYLILLDNIIQNYKCFSPLCCTSSWGPWLFRWFSDGMSGSSCTRSACAILFIFCWWQSCLMTAWCEGGWHCWIWRICCYKTLYLVLLSNNIKKYKIRRNLVITESLNQIRYVARSWQAWGCQHCQGQQWINSLHL